MNKLADHFDRIAVISLPDRSDRREQLLANLTQTGLATNEDLTWIEAVDGRKEKIPTWWKAGPGAWGCRASQLRAIEAAQNDGLENVLIIEDDAIFHNRVGEWLGETLSHLPSDWDLFFLGGQHLQPPKATSHPRLLKGSYITRTHAYAVHQRAFESVISNVRSCRDYREHPGWHVDHQLGYHQFHKLWNSYAPAWWFAGQNEGESNISIQANPRRWWQNGEHYWKLPFVISSGPALDPALVHHNQELPPTRTMEIAIWLRNIAHEAWLQGRLPSCSLDPAQISALWPGGLRNIKSQNELVQLADYPANALFRHPFALKFDTN